jgi:ribose/xylose/arabinose/galactoside ABC-type transport system permease subunit
MGTGYEFDVITAVILGGVSIAGGEGRLGFVVVGVLIMGVSGCGKSLAVKAIASCFDLPLYRVDMIEIFSGMVFLFLLVV